MLRNVMATLAERALLVAVRHVAESKPRWPRAELRAAWNKIAMTNRRLACRISSYRISQWYTRLICGRENRMQSQEPVVDDSAGGNDEPWGDEDGNWWDIESCSDSSSSSNYNFWHG